MPAVDGPKLPNRKVQRVHAKAIPKFQNLLQKSKQREHQHLNIAARSDGHLATWAYDFDAN